MDAAAQLADLRRQLAEAKLQTDEVTRQRDQAQAQLRPTTLGEYLDGNHNYVFTRFNIEQDPARTTQGHTDPKAKWVPRCLVPWSDFLDVQTNVLAQVHRHFPPTARVFENINSLKGLGARIANRANAHEHHVEFFQKEVIEEPVLAIIEQLRTIEALRKVFPFGQEVSFDRYLMLGNEAIPKQRKADKTRADQHCTVLLPGRGLRKVVLVAEYKVPHKLTLGHLRVGANDMDIYQDVVNSVRKPTDKDELFEYNAKSLVAAALVQTFHYMIENGVEYGYVTTCEGILFLKIDWAAPDTLFYHLAEPAEEYQAHPENRRDCTAVSQVLALTLLALQAPPHSQAERRTATRSLNVWKADDALMWSLMPESERKQEATPAGFKARIYTDFRRIPNPPRAVRTKTTCNTALSDPGRDDDKDGNHDDESSDGPSPPDTPVPQKKSGTRTEPSSSSSSHDENSGRRHYCTQKCLLGLVRLEPLDEKCPNVASHRPPASKNYHPVNHETWLELVREQLNTELDHDIEPLGLQGAIGAIFRVTLSKYGYTFLAKGTIEELGKYLAHEADVYNQLRPLQGLCVPVFLGAVNLHFPYFYTYGERIHHMTLLSWAGDMLHHDDIAQKLSQPQLCKELTRSIHAVHAAGVLQADVRTANALWNEECGRVFMIDFERARIVQDRYLRLVHDGPANINKRPFSALEDDDDNQSPIDRRIVASCRTEMMIEIHAANHVFEHY